MPELPPTDSKLKLNKEAAKIDITAFSTTESDCLVYLPVLEGEHYHVTHDESNWLRGIKKRLAAEPNPINHDLRNEFFDFVRDKMLPQIEILPPGLDENFLMEEWLENSNYNGKRKDVLRTKYREYQDGIKINRVLACKSFIKSEFYQEFKEPRTINSRSDWFKAKVGGYIHAMEKLVYDDHFIKHKLPIEVASKMSEISEGYSYFYVTDYSSFEGTFYHEMQCNVEFRLFQHCLHNYPEIVSLISKCYSNRNVMIFKNKYIASIPGRRMSGDMWTSMANGFTNKCIVEFMMYKAQTQGNYLVEGDDGFICTAKPIDTSIPNEIGFSLKCEAKEDPGECSFCSLRQHNGLLVPDIIRTLRSYGSVIDFQLVHAYKSRSKRGQKILNDYAKSNAYSLLSRSKGIPILQTLALQQINHYSKAHIRRYYCDYWLNQMFKMDVSIEPKEITQSMREYVNDVFHIYPKKQIRIEQEIAKMKTPSYKISM